MKDDAISRQAAINTLIRESQADGAYGYLDAKSISDALERMPSVDAVEVVRCRDCKYCSHDVIFSQHWCVGRLVDLDDFCSRGERK